MVHCIYPKRLRLHSRYTFHQFLLSLGIEPMTLVLLALYSTVYEISPIWFIKTLNLVALQSELFSAFMLCPLQANWVSSEQALQKHLEEVSEELRQTQSSRNSLQTQLEQAQKDATALAGQHPLGS